MNHEGLGEFTLLSSLGFQDSFEDEINREAFFSL
jgi:hypothetical protein